MTTLNISDLQLTIQLLSLATNRGAWRVEELETVGGLYSRFKAVVEVQTSVPQVPSVKGKEPMYPKRSLSPSPAWKPPPSTVSSSSSSSSKT